MGLFKLRRRIFPEIKVNRPEPKDFKNLMTKVKVRLSGKTVFYWLKLFFKLAKSISKCLFD